MCGIIAILRGPNGGESLDGDRLLLRAQNAFKAADSALGALDSELSAERVEALSVAAGAFDELVRVLRTPSGVRAVLANEPLERALSACADKTTAACDRLEQHLDAASADPGSSSQGSSSLRAGDVERANAALLALRDSLWAIRRDALLAVSGVRSLLEHSGVTHEPAVRAALSMHQALSALDRLEVRGRDSAGIHLLCTGHGLDPQAPEVAALLERRTSPLFENRAVRFARTREGSTCLSVVVKVAEEIGELGDNVAALRGDLERDELLAMALRSEDLQISVLGHTRWASVGLITQPNAHPLNQELADDDPSATDQEPYVVAALNGDVDNYAELMESHGLGFADEITTDAKVIPALVAQRLQEGATLETAVQATVSGFVGSVAIGLETSVAPHELWLAQRGSGQALYAGLGDDVFVLASEPYGLVEVCSQYVRLDGETPGNPQNPSGSRGQILRVRAERAGSLEGLRRWAYDGTELPLGDSEIRRAEMTTRDVDRGDYPHYLLKEISESPRSFEKTLRGRLRRDEASGAWRVDLGRRAIPDAVADRLRSGSLQRILVIGQGTAAVAGAGVAEGLRGLLGERVREIRALPATELSGFGLRGSMADTLVIAISQSGTTTDTNRTVDLVRARGAAVLAIVNRRNSDLCDKADGVLYTSDGRDIEMSVASTKAFYSQIAAGFLMASALSDLAPGELDRDAQQGLLSGLAELPQTLRKVIARREEIAAIAEQFAPPKRYWAIVGNGLNRVAAEEIRIKLSELCYKAIACDATEDKKHIDLSSEPLILVCAAGLEGSNADDVGKEVAIYGAHKAIPLVIASDRVEPFEGAAQTIAVPPVHPLLDFVVASLVGHLFGYGAALAIDRQAHPLRATRAAIESLAHEWIEAGDSADLFGSLSEQSESAMEEFLQGLRAGRYDGHLEASTASNLEMVLRTVLGQISLEGYSAVRGQPASPALIIEELSAALTQGIDELTRPVDAIKHQAKTVTVGISRSDEALLTLPLVQEALARGTRKERVAYSDLRTLAALDPVVTSVHGHTRYELDGTPSEESASIRVVAAEGIATQFSSRTAEQPLLRGTKRRVALERRLLVARGSADGRLFLVIPEVEGTETTALQLLHIELSDRAPVSVLRPVLRGYRGRYGELRDAVMETEDAFEEGHLDELSVEELLIEPIDELAERWRSRSASDPSAAGPILRKVRDSP